jgi:hypothetical protein
MYYVHLTSDKKLSAAITDASIGEAKMRRIIKTGVGLTPTITNIELLNPTSYSMILPNTASLAISVKEIRP